jgi:hypothetical protein
MKVSLSKLFLATMLGCTITSQALRAQTPCLDPSLIDSTVFCPAVYDPVCGCDGITYPNACFAVNYAGIVEYAPGECPSAPCAGECFFEIEAEVTGLEIQARLTSGAIDPPVPAQVFWSLDNGAVSSSQTQFNTVVLQAGRHVLCARYSRPGGGFCEACTVLETGVSCIDSALIDPDGICPAVYAPVCGCNGITYSNDCEAQVFGGVTSWTPGPCPGALTCLDTSLLDPMVLCPAIYQPVCGCDGKTYPNTCVAQYYNGVTQWNEGPCNQPCTDAGLVDLSLGCFEIYDPVCGCDGITYPNDCYARNFYGVISWKKGPCCASNNNCKAFFWKTAQDGLNITLQDASIQAETWFLDWGDGSIQNGGFTEIQHSFPAPGTYLVCLNISSFTGACSDTYCQEVTVGLSQAEEPAAGHFILSPNPARELFRLYFEPDGGGPLQVRIFDALGHLMWQQQVVQSGQEIRTSGWPAGVYFVQAGGKTMKLIINY